MNDFDEMEKKKLAAEDALPEVATEDVPQDSSSIEEEKNEGRGIDDDEMWLPNIKDINLVRPVYQLRGVLEGTTDEVKGKIISKHLNEENSKCSRHLSINIKPIEFEVLLSLTPNLGEALLIDSNCIFISSSNSTNYIMNMVGQEPYQGISIDIFADSMDKVRNGHETIQETFKDYVFSGVSILELSWLFTSSGRVKRYCITEEIDDIFFKESYPYLDIEKFSEIYLESEVPIIVLTGPPGTGKTRLIRYIIQKMCETKSSGLVKGVFTSDKVVIEEGEIFLNLLADDVDLLILEDIDYNLRPREEGNTSMYNLLSTSNGILANTMKKKKIILSTNLTNTSKIDSALIRPGRCFDVINTRPLLQDEARTVLKLLGKDRILRGKEYTLAELYNDSKDLVLKGAGF